MERGGVRIKNDVQVAKVAMERQEGARSPKKRVNPS